MATCPNKNLKAWEDLTSQYGEVGAMFMYTVEKDIPTAKRAQELALQYELVEDLSTPAVKTSEFDPELESLSNMIMNKLLPKTGKFSKKRNSKEDYFYASERSIKSKTERDIVTSIFSGFEKSTLDSNSDKELISRLKEQKANLEKVQKEKTEKRRVELETLYSQKRVLESFSKEENKEALLKYDKDQQEVIKSYFSLLWKENKYNSEKQAFTHQTSLVKKKINNKINNTKNYLNTYHIGAAIKKIEVGIKLIEEIPNWRQLVNEKINNEYERRLEYKNTNLNKNPELVKTIEFRKLWAQASFMTQEFGFEKEYGYLAKHKTKIKKLLPTFDSSKPIMATTNSVDILTRIKENKNSKYKNLAASLLDFAEKNNVEIVITNTDKASAGNYNAKIGQIQNEKGEVVASFIKNQLITIDGLSNRFGVDPERLILHEIVHSLSTILIASESYRKDGESIFEKYLDYLRRQSRNLRDRNGAFLDMSNPYGFENAQELFSEALTNPEFREVLKMIPATESKVYNSFLEEFLDKVKEFISNLFSKGKDYPNALEQLEDLIYNTFEAQSNMPKTEAEVLESLEGDIENYKVVQNNKKISVNQVRVKPVESRESKRGQKDLKIREKYFPTKTVKSSEVLKKIGESNHPLSKLATHLQKHISKNDVDIELIDKKEADLLMDVNILKPRTAGAYFRDENKIIIRENVNFQGRGSEPTLLHEILHALSSKELRSNSAAKQKFEEFYNYLKPKFEQYSEESEIGYAFKNIDELLVGIFTNAALVKELLNTPARTKKYDSIFSELLDFFLTLLDMRPKSTVYKEAFALASEVLGDKITLLNEAEQILSDVLSEREAPPVALDNKKLVEEAEKPKSFSDYITLLKKHFAIQEYRAGEEQLYIVKRHLANAKNYIASLHRKFGWEYEDGVYEVREVKKETKSNWIYINRKKLENLIGYKSSIRPSSTNLQMATQTRVKNVSEIKQETPEKNNAQEIAEEYGFDKTGFLTKELSPSRLESLQRNLELLGFELLQNDKGAYYIGLNGDMLSPSQSELFSLSSDKPSKTNVELNIKLKEFLHKLGFETRYLDEIRDRDGNLIDAAAKVDFLNKLVEVVEGREKVDTLPEEAAHILFELVINTPIGQSIMNNIQFSAVYNEVVEQYGELYNNDENRLKREAAGKMLAAAMQDKFNSKDSGNTQKRQRNWLQRVLDFFKKLIAGYSKEMILKELNANIDIIAEKAMSEDLGFFEGTTEGAQELYQYIGPANPLKQKAVKEAIEKTQEEIVGTVKVGDKYKYQMKSGTIIDNRVSDIVEKIRKKLYGESDPDQNVLTHSAVTGSILHRAQELVMQEIIKRDGKIDAFSDAAKLNNFKKEITAKLRVEFSSNKEVSDWVKSHPNLDFFDLSYSSFKELFEGTDYLYKYIKNMDPDATIMTEVKIFDESRKLGGTIDLLVIHRDGSVSIADFKTKRLNPNKTEQFNTNQRLLWSTQTREYTDMLKNNYGVSEVKSVMVVPIFVDRTSPDFEVATGKANAITKVRMLNKTTPKKDALRYIPTDSSRLGYKALDEYLQRMKGLQEELVKKLKTGQNYSEVKEKLDAVTLLIDKILVDNDVTPMFRQLQSIYELIEDTQKFQELDLVALNNMLNMLKLFKGDTSSKYFMVSFIQFVDKKMKETKDEAELAKLKALKENIALWNAQSDLMINSITDRIKEVANEQHRINLDVAVKNEGFFNRMFSGLIDKTNPVFLALARLIRGAKEETRLKRQAAFDIILEKDKALQNWAKRNGKSVKDAYKMIITDRKNLINKFSDAYWEEYKKAKKEKDVDWLRKHTKIDLKRLEEKLNDYLDPGKVYNNDVLEERRKQVNKHLVRDNATGEILGVNDSMYSMIGYKNIFGNAIKLNTEDSFVKTLDKRFINEKWLQLTRPENAEVLDYYNMYVNFNEEFFKLTDGRIKRNFIAEIERTMLDNVDELSIREMFSHGSFREAFAKKFEIKEHDVEGTFDSEGNPTKQIPLLFFSKLTGTSLSKAEKSKIEEEVGKQFQKGTDEYVTEVSKRERALLREKGIAVKSIDLSSSLLLMAESVYEYHHLSQIEETAKAYRTVLNLQKRVALDDRGNAMINSLSKKALEIMNVDPDVISDFEAFTDMHIYKKNTTKDYVFGKNKKYSSSKVLNFFMTYLSTKALGLNLPLAMASATGAQMNRIMLGKEKTFWKPEQMSNASKRLLKPFSKERAKINAAIDFFEVSSRPMTKEKTLELTKNKLSKTLSLRNIFVAHRKGDDLIDNQILLAMMDNYVIDKADGKLKNPLSIIKKHSTIIDSSSPTMAEAFKFDEKTGKATLEVEGLTEEQIKQAVLEFRTIANGVATRIKGTQTFENQNLANASLIGRAFMQFRNWMPGLITTRGAQFNYNEALQEYDYGRFRVALGEILEGSIQGSSKNVAKLFAEALGMGFYSIYDSRGIDTELAERYLEEFKKENPGLEITLEEFIELRKSKLQGTAAELRIYMLMGLAVSLLAYLGFDDDDENNVLVRNLYKAWERSFLEVSFFFDPDSVTSIVSSPLPLWRLTNDVSTLWKNTADESLDLLFGEDSARDRSPKLHYLSKQIPILNQILEIMGYYDKNNVKSKGVVSAAIDRL